jgi:hypothetical protein
VRGQQLPTEIAGSIAPQLPESKPWHAQDMTLCLGQAGGGEGAVPMFVAFEHLRIRRRHEGA